MDDRHINYMTKKPKKYIFKKTAQFIMNLLQVTTIRPSLELRAC
jgi:hypothetical protein